MSFELDFEDPERDNDNVEVFLDALFEWTPSRLDREFGLAEVVFFELSTPHLIDVEHLVCNISLTAMSFAHAGHRRSLHRHL